MGGKKKTKKKKKQRAQQQPKQQKQQLSERNTPAVVTNDGLFRHVEPSDNTVSVHSAAGLTLLDACTTRLSIPDAVARKLICSGRVFVADAVCRDAARVLRKNERLHAVAHRHEPPVTGAPVEIIAQTADLVVVAKPASIPVHPCGPFFHNCLTKILEREHNLCGLRVIHRIDRQTSGVLLLGKTSAATAVYQSIIAEHRAQKQYVARVSGRFPSAAAADGEEEFTVVDAPLVDTGKTMKVGKGGKPAITKFKLVGYDAESNTSVVLAFPLHGRKHQIRVHLAHIGHPIPNDPVYCSNEKPIVQDGGCPVCGGGWKPDQKTFAIWLHALQYDGPGFSFRAPPPHWVVFPV